MPDFHYQGRDSVGKRVTGTLSSIDERTAASSLGQQGITPLVIKPATNAKKSVQSSSEMSLGDLFARSVPLPDIIMFIRQMYSLTKAGVPMLRAVEGLAGSATNRKLAKSLTTIVEELEKGRSLSAAMADHPDCFPKMAIAVIHVGENTGRLDDSFLQLGIYMERELETRKRIKAATRYPMFVVFFLMLAVVVLNVWVIPVFAGMFQSAGVELPLVTRILLGTSGFFVEFWWLLVVGSVGLSYAIYTILKAPEIREQWDYVKLRLPLVGDVLERSLLSRFARSFSVMLNAGVPLTTSLGLVSDTLDNEYMSKRVRNMRRGIERGESLTRVSRNSELFTPLVLQMFLVGEETGSLDKLLAEAADYYEREVDYDLKNLTTWIEPILISVVAVMVLILAMGIFLPMWEMMGMY